MSERITDIPQLPPRPADGHKGLFGKVLVVGGSRGMVGAPALAGLAALRSGAGLVRIATPGSIQLTVAQLVPCATTLALPEDEKGRLSKAAVNEILNAIEDNDSVALGPGMGQSTALQELMMEVVRPCPLPMVIDADALNNLAAAGPEALQFTDNTVLTPHPGEMARLWRACFREELPPQRLDQAEKLAQRCGAVVVLKGAGTVVTDGKRTYINETGNPGMATGGTGDVLTGCIAALLGQKAAARNDALSAAILGVYVHGRAGDLAAKKMGQTALIATDLIDSLAGAFAPFTEKLTLP